MFENVLIAGDSFAFGSEMANRSKCRYSSIVSKELNAKEYNFTYPGICNELISSYFITETLSLLSKNLINPNNTLVLISWSFLMRKSFFSKYNNIFITLRRDFVKIKKNKNQILDILTKSKHQLLLDDLYSFYKSHDSDLYKAYYTFKNIYFTQLFLDSYKFKYIFLIPDKAIYDVMLNYKYEITNNKEFKYSELVEEKTKYNGGSYLPDPKQFLDNINMDNFFDKFIVNFAEENNFKVGEESHPLEDAHREYSNLLIDHINSKWR